MEIFPPARLKIAQGWKYDGRKSVWGHCVINGPPSPGIITWDHHLAIGSAADGLIATRPIAASIPSIEDSGRLDRLGLTVAGGVFYHRSGDAPAPV